MYKSAHGKVTVSTFFDSRIKVEIAGKKLPVKIRVWYNRERKDYPTGKKLTIEEWGKLPSSREREYSKIRNEIQSSFKIVDDIVFDLVQSNNFSFDNLNRQLSKGSGDTLNTAFRAKIKYLETEGREGSREFYSNALKSIERFKSTPVEFSDISPEWLKRYEEYLRKEVYYSKNRLVQGKTDTTIGMYMRAIRAVINESGAIKPNQYPFGKGKYRIPDSEGRKLALSMNQIKSIVQFDDGRESTAQYRDLWFFSYLCNGANFNDVIKLKYSNIVGDEIYFYRKKSILTSKKKHEIRAAVTPEMQSIIDRWGNSDRRPENFIFPFLVGDESPADEKRIVKDITKRVNKRLKVIGKVIGVEKLTTYSARHSFATVLKRSGANISYISESLGHNDLKTTENYLASFEKEERRKNAALLTNFE